MAEQEPKIISGWRWLGRLGIAAAALALIAAAAWSIWLWETIRRCDAFIAAMQARGDAVTWDSWKAENLPDEQNAAYYLKQAGSAMVLPPPATPTYQQWLASGGATRPASRPAPVSWQAARANVSRNATSLSLAHQARQFGRAQWTTAPPPGTLPVFTNMSALAKLIRDDALLHHENGEDREAAEDWRDIAAEARAISAGPSTLIGGLIVVIVDGIGADGMLAIAPGIHIDSPGGLSEAEVRKLIAELLDDGLSREALAEGWLAERRFGTHSYVKGTYSASPLPMRPLLYSQMHRWWVQLDNMIRDAREVRPTRSVPIDEYSRLLGIIPQFGSVTNDVANLCVQRRLAAITLAIQLFHHKTGRYPAALAELVPGYLAKVPEYPGTGWNKAIGYLLLEGGRRPVVYVAPTTSKPADIAKGIPAKHCTLGSYSSQGEAVGYFDASAWQPEGASTRESLDDHHH